MEQRPAEGTASGTPDWLEVVRRQVESLRYGVVQITVHADQVVQIERTERLRFDARESPRPDRRS